MHEMSIAVSIARGVGEVLLQHESRNPVAVRIRAGCMTGIVTEALEQAFAIAAELELGCVPTLMVEQVPVSATCGDCQRAFESMTFPAVCPQCGGIGIRILGGDELELVSVEVEDDEDDNGQGTHPQG